MSDDKKTAAVWPLDQLPPHFGRPANFTAVDSVRLLGDPTQTFTGQAVSLFSNHVATKFGPLDQ